MTFQAGDLSKIIREANMMLTGIICFQTKLELRKVLPDQLLTDQAIEHLLGMIANHMDIMILDISGAELAALGPGWLLHH